MTLTSSSVEGKQLNLFRGNIIFCHVDSFCLQREMEDEGEEFCDPYAEATASALPQQKGRWLTKI